LEQVSVPTTQVHPAGPDRVWAVVFAGTVSTTVTPVAVLGPLLVTTWVYVIVPFASTGTGLGVFVIDKSDVSATMVFTVALLFPLLGSVVVERTESDCVIVVPEATVAPTFTTKLKVAVALATIAAVAVHFKVPKEQVHPAGPVNDTAVVPAGRVSLRTGAAAEAAPEFVTVCV
jgi:hypothetical protein